MSERGILSHIEYKGMVRIKGQDKLFSSIRIFIAPDPNNVFDRFFAERSAFAHARAQVRKLGKEGVAAEFQIARTDFINNNTWVMEKYTTPREINPKQYATNL